MAALLTVVGSFAAVLGLVAWLGTRARRLGGAVMSPFDEIWHPSRHRARIEVQIRQEQLMPLPPADDAPGA